MESSSEDVDSSGEVYFPQSSIDEDSDDNNSNPSLKHAQAKPLQKSDDNKNLDSDDSYSISSRKDAQAIPPKKNDENENKDSDNNDSNPSPKHALTKLPQKYDNKNEDSDDNVINPSPKHAQAKPLQKSDDNKNEGSDDNYSIPSRKHAQAKQPQKYDENDKAPATKQTSELSLHEPVHLLSNLEQTLGLELMDVDSCSDHAKSTVGGEPSQLQDQSLLNQDLTFNPVKTPTKVHHQLTLSPVLKSKTRSSRDIFKLVEEQVFLYDFFMIRK